VCWEDILLRLLQDYVCPMKVCGWQVRSTVIWKGSKLQVQILQKRCESSLGDEMVSDGYEHQYFKEEKVKKVTKINGRMDSM